MEVGMFDSNVTGDQEKTGQDRFPVRNASSCKAESMKGEWAP